MKLTVRNTFALIFIAALVLLIVGLSALNSFAAGQETKRVFVLNSYHRGFTFSDNEMRGIDDAFGKSGIKIETYTTYMNMKRIPTTPQYFLQLKELIREGYKGVRFDAVLACDNDALGFMRKYRDELFPGAPLVFSAINDFDERILDGRRDITGTIENTSYAGTISIALKLRPATKNIVVVTDNTTTGVAHRSKVDKIRPDFPQSLGFTYLSLGDMTLDELAQKVSKLNSDSIVLLLVPVVDKNGTYYTVQESTSLIAKSAPVLVFVVVDSRMGFGALGGHLVSGYSQGETAAQMVVKILDGTDVRTIPVLLESPNRYMFDYNVMQRFSIAEKDLPQGSILINKPFSVLDKYGPQLFTILGVFIVLCGLVFYFLLEIRRRKRAEETLRESEEEYRNLYNNAQVGLAHTRISDGKVLSCNQKMAQIFGYNNTKDFINEYLFSENYVDPEKREKILSEMNQTGVQINLEAEFYKKDKSKLWARFDTRIFPDKGYMEDVVIDITERKIAEMHLRENEEKYRILVEESPLGIVLISSEGGYKYINPKFIEIFGYSIEDIPTGKQWFTKAFPDEKYRIQVISTWKKDQIEFPVGESRPRTFTVTCKNGLKKIINFLPVAMNTGDQLMLCEDITEEKSLQNRLQQSLKMESVGNLAGGIAHDFNNILSSIIGFTELALDDVERGTPLEDKLQEVYTAGKRARDLIKQILAFARQSDEERKPIQVDIIAKEVLKLIRSTIPTTIEIKENIESHSMVMGNPSQIHQLLMNLCTNAAQAMEDAGGILEVRVTDVEHKNKSPLTQLGLRLGNYMKITVSDTGPGILPDIIGSIFEPYFTTKGVGEGTGMGLALVHGIVESYGGKITVESKLGQTTIFSIYLPITKKIEDQRSYEKEKLPSGTERILFVDDELPIAKMSGQALERLGYRVTVRTSSVEALELFRFKPDGFDLVITDMTMPNITGDQLAVELLKIRPNILVILCTGYSKKISDETASSIGIKAFAYKPIVKADLAQTVRKVLDEAKDSDQV